MEEALLEGQNGVSERLERAAGMLDMVTISGALGVSHEVADAYLSGELVYPDDEDGLERLEQLDLMCESLGGAVFDSGEVDWDEEGVEGRIEEEDALVVERVDVEGPVDQFAGGLGGAVVGTGVGQPAPGRTYRRLGEGRIGDPVGGRAVGRRSGARRAGGSGVGDVGADAPVPEGTDLDGTGEVMLGLDMDGDGKVDVPLPGAMVTPRSGNWNDDIEDRRQALWTAWSIAQMTQNRLMKHKETVAALSWVAEIELALISFYGDSVPDPGVRWDMERKTREINTRLERLRWAREEQEREYGGLKGVMRWLVGDRVPSGKELYRRMVDEADRLLDSVDIGDTGATVMDAALKRHEAAEARRRR